MAGKITMAPDGKVPQLDFFKQVGELSVQVRTRAVLILCSKLTIVVAVQARFSNAGKFGKDDRVASVRGCTMKIGRGNEASWDLLFNTGSTSVFENHMTFAMNAMANKALENGDIESYKKWLYAGFSLSFVGL